MLLRRSSECRQGRCSSRLRNSLLRLSALIRTHRFLGLFFCLVFLFAKFLSNVTGWFGPEVHNVQLRRVQDGISNRHAGGQILGRVCKCLVILACRYHRRFEKHMDTAFCSFGISKPSLGSTPALIRQLSYTTRYDAPAFRRTCTGRLRRAGPRHRGRFWDKRRDPRLW